ncbi:MAG: ADP-glyceromanno-heptose 6-epimerase [Chitinophagia bacterium]|nr:ADP-glyceromanno-heptose 6-epimerase [Chitinophagia bacterium]
MDKNHCIAITGAAGFIGSYLTGFLNQKGYTNLILVDDFTQPAKKPNFIGKRYARLIDRNSFIEWWTGRADAVQYCFHLGARTDTTEPNYAIHKHFNLDYSIAVWERCYRFNVPLVYASSAATYGNGDQGYDDTGALPTLMQPLNAYGISKNQFDIWASRQEYKPPFWAGLKFFNVYGPNEYHKNRMASVIFHAYNQIKQTGAMRLFKSHHPNYADGQQQRDFIYVKDIINIAEWMMRRKPQSGIYNAGTGKARTFNDLATAVFNAMQLPVNIEYIDTPTDIRDKYQYYTQAKMDKLLAAGYPHQFYELETGVQEYVTQYLKENKYF